MGRASKAAAVEKLATRAGLRGARCGSCGATTDSTQTLPSHTTDSGATWAVCDACAADHRLIRVVPVPAITESKTLPGDRFPKSVVKTPASQYLDLAHELMPRAAAVLGWERPTRALGIVLVGDPAHDVRPWRHDHEFIYLRCDAAIPAGPAVRRWHHVDTEGLRALVAAKQRELDATVAVLVDGSGCGVCGVDRVNRATGFTVRRNVQMCGDCAASVAGCDDSGIGSWLQWALSDHLGFEVEPAKYGIPENVRTVFASTRFDWIDLDDLRYRHAAAVAKAGEKPRSAVRY